MRYQLNEEKGDIRYEVEDDTLILKVKPGVVSGGGSGSGSGDGIYHIKENDVTTPSDDNAFTALRVLKEIMDKITLAMEDANGKYIRKDIADIAYGLITFLSGAEFGEYIEGLSGAKIDADGNAEVNSLLVRLKAIVDELQVNGNAEFRGNLSSEEFLSGFVGGKGWAILKQAVTNALGETENKYTAEFDNVVVRGTLRVFTMAISQLLGENDNRIFAGMMEVDHYDAESGKVYLSTNEGRYYNPFRVDDYIMVQQYNGMPSEDNDYYITKHYECIITGAGCGSEEDGENRLDWVTISNFVSADGKTAEETIKKGDTFTRVDNATDADRKGIIQIITVGTATPYMDIIYGLKTDPDNYLKGRLGNLKGIKHHLFGWLDGFGEYLTNLYAVGDFRLRQTGESVNAAVQMTRDQFATNYSKVTYDITEDNNLLTNATFTESMEGWITPEDDSTKLLYVNSKDEDGNATIEPFIVNSALMATNGKYAKVEPYDGRNMLHIRNSSVTQANSYIAKPGTHTEYSTVLDDAGVQQDKAVEVGNTIYLSVKFMAKTSGVLTIGMPDADHSDVDAMQYVQQNINSSYDWQTVQTYGTWDGNGDFVLGYTGEMYVALLSITEKPLDDYKKSVSTKFEQTADHISVLGENINKVDGRVTTLGTTWDAEKGEIYSYVNEKDAEGLETAKSEITQTAKSITAQVEAVDNSLGETNKRVSTVEQTASGLSSRVSSVEGRVTTAETNITQTADSISAVASKFNSDGSLKNTSGLLTTADGNSLSSQITDIDGKLLTKAEIATSVQYDPKSKKVTSDITLSADKITLTADGSDSISQIKQTAEGLSFKVATLEGDVSTNSTLITQNTDSISAVASKFNSDGSLKNTSGLMTTADGASLSSQITDINGQLKTKAEISTSVQKDGDGYISNAKIKADRILLEGLVTANKNFQIDTSGNMTAVNGTFTGTVNADKLVCSNVETWGGPGILTIGHVQNTVNIYTRYSVNGIKMSQISKSTDGTHTIWHNLGHTNYTVLWIGACSTTNTGSGFLGTISITSKSKDNFTILCKDTDNNKHSLIGNDVQVDFIMIGYNK